MNTDRITIRDLKVQARVGVSEAERSEPQTLSIGIEIDADLSTAAASDRLEDTIDYGAVAADVARLVRAADARLLESIADEVARHLLELEGVLGVSVEVLKEHPPISEDVGPVGVRIVRR